MVIVLIDGKVIRPLGGVTPDVFGIMIREGAEKLTIPHNQIKWIYENPDYMKEEQFISNLKSRTKNVKPFNIDKTSSELIKDLYGD